MRYSSRYNGTVTTTLEDLDVEFGTADHGGVVYLSIEVQATLRGDDIEDVRGVILDVVEDDDNTAISPYYVGQRLTDTDLDEIYSGIDAAISAAGEEARWCNDAEYADLRRANW